MSRRSSPSIERSPFLSFEQLEPRDLPATSGDVALAAVQSTMLDQTHTLIQAPASGLDKAAWGGTEAAMDSNVIGVIHPHPGGYMAAPALSPDGSRVITGGTSDSKVRVWDATTGAMLLDLTGHSGPVKAVAVSPDGSLIASVSHDQTARLWDMKTGALQKTFSLGALGDGVQFSPDGKSFAVNAYGRGMIVVDTASGAIRDLPRDGGDDPEQFAFSPTGGTITYSMGNANTATWSLTENRMLFKVSNGETARRVAYAPSGEFFATGTDSGLINFWNAKTGAKVATIDARLGLGGEAHVTSLAFSHDGKTLLSGNVAGKVYEWNVANIGQGSLPAQPEKSYGLGWMSNFITFSPTDRTFFAVSSPSGAQSRLLLTRRLPEPLPPPVIVPAQSTAPVVIPEAQWFNTSATDVTMDTTTAAIEALVTAAEQEMLGYSNPLLEAALATVQAPAAVEKVEAIDSPAMHVSVERLSGSVRLFIRFRSPYDRSTFQVGSGFSINSNVAGTDAEHPGGTRDMTVMIENNGSAFEGSLLPIRMRAPDGKILQTVYASWDPNAKSLRIDTQQESFEKQTSKMMEMARETIAPAMQVAADGRILFVRVQTPSDRSYIEVSRGQQMDSLNRGAEQELSHPGGTREGLVQIAIPANAPVNEDLKLRLWDKRYGNILREVALRTDGVNVQIIDGQAQLTDAIPQTEVIKSVLAANDQIRAIQGATLYERSAFFVSSGELEMRLIARNVNGLFPSDQKAYLASITGPSDVPGIVEDSFLSQQKDTRSHYREVLNNYANTMAGLLAASVDFWTRIRAGETERPLYDALMAKVNAANVGAIEVLGIAKPQFAQVLDAGRGLCAEQREMIVRTVMDDMAATARAASDAQAKITTDEIAGTSAPKYVSPLGPEQDRQSAHLQRLIAQAILSGDSRVVTLSTEKRSNLLTSVYGSSDITVKDLYAKAGMPDVRIMDTTKIIDAKSWASLVTGTRDLGFISLAGKNTPEVVRMNPNESAKITFTLQQDSMVNFWLDTARVGLIHGFEMPKLPDLALTLTGSTLQNPYESHKPGNAAESISSVLPAGTYTLTVSDRTIYPVSSLVTNTSPALPLIPIEMDIAPRSTTNIRGRISIPERLVSMPVSMRVAEFAFESGKRIEDMNRVHSLNPMHPVWVVIHGMDSSDRSDSLTDVTRELQAYPNMQVVTINWEDAAKDGIITQDARWTRVVGQWAARQLIAAGFSPSLINIAGWSHGSYVAFHLSEEIATIKQGEQINALVALDPAGNIPLISGYIHEQIDFKKFSRNAIALEGSLGAGSNYLAGTADFSIRINSPGTAPAEISAEHSLPVTAFAAILNHERTYPGTFSNYISLQNIMDASKRIGIYSENSYAGAFEITIDVTVSEHMGLNGTYTYANPTALRIRLPDGLEKIIPLNSLA